VANEQASPASPAAVDRESLRIAVDPAVPSAPQPYDFRRPYRISTDRLRALRVMHENLGSSLEGWLLSRVRGDIEISLQGLEQCSFGEFTASLPTPCASYTFELGQPGAHGGVVDFGIDFAFFLVDRLFGGGTTVGYPDRPLTPIERMGVRTIAERAVATMAETWREYMELEPSLVGFESVPEMIRIANREDPVLVATYDAVVTKGSSRLAFCLPFSVVEKFLAVGTVRRAAAPHSAEEQAVSQALAESALRGTRVTVSARLPQFPLTLGEVMSLQAGSLVDTGISRTAELDVHVGDQCRFRALPGRVSHSLAVRITEGVLPTPETMTVPLTRNRETTDVS
jgi:flagellar motor switch protein FliM